MIRKLPIAIVTFVAFGLISLTGIGFFTPVVFRSGPALSPSVHYAKTHGVPRYHELRFQKGTISVSRAYLGCDSPKCSTWSVLGMGLAYEAMIENGVVVEKTTARTIALIPIALLIAFPCHCLIQGPITRYRRCKNHRCIECGYDLTGNTSGTCPECGQHCGNLDAKSGASG